MKKSYLFMVLFAFAMVFMTGCGDAQLPVTQSTTSAVYQFYTDELLTVQDETLTEILQTSFSDGSDQDRINTIVNNIAVLSREECVVLASIQCFDLVSENNKEIIVDTIEGALHVNGIGNSFTCTLIDENATTLATYTLSISKNNNTYTLNYTKMVNGQSQPCVAIVTYDRSTSYLRLDITSRSDLDQNVQITKTFYSLVNSQKALQVEISINGYNYGARYFRTAQDCKLKLSRKTSMGQNITIDELTIDNFCRTGNDTCGYVISGEPFDGADVSDTPQNTYSYFGNLSEW